MKNLILIPTKRELTAFTKRTDAEGIKSVKLAVGDYEALQIPEVHLVIARGGLGKAQFAVQTQYFIDRLPQLKAVICAGAAGSLLDNAAVGDIVVATETIEHDIRSYTGNVMPRFQPEASLLQQFESFKSKKKKYAIHFGPVASGDEDVMADKRKIEVKKQTGAIAVAWEGAGGARACRFSKIPYIEVRTISDAADDNARTDFFKNLDMAIGNLAELILEWAGS